MTTSLLGPYAQAATTYREAGWLGVLPLPALAKTPPPNGFTGHGGAFPTDEAVAYWAAELGEGNVALRVPQGVIGIDVDHYGTKRGGDVLAELEAQWGRLPATFVSSSRPWPSGIRLYAVPPGQYETVIPGGIEIVQHHHRYMVVWPSVHPDTGAVYGWTDPDGEACSVPMIEDLPELPAAWIEGLSRAWSTSSEVVDNGEVAPQWHQPHDWSPQVTAAYHRIDLTHPGGRHDAATAGAMALARLEQLGHPGATTALGALEHDFLYAVMLPGEGQRAEQAAVREWTSILTTARERARTSPAASEPYIDPAWLAPYVEAEHARALAAGTAALSPVEEALEAVYGDVREAHDFLAEPDPEFDWLVPGLLEKGDRLILTGQEGKGKSTLLRQMAAQVASGIHPFDPEATFPPVKVVLIDLENSPRHLRRKLGGLVAHLGQRLRRDQLWIVPKPEGIDLGGPADVAWLGGVMDEVQPDLLIIGPIYKMSDGDPTEEMTAKPVVKVLDALRARHDCAMLIEAHTPHEGKTERPYGASLWKRWPEFGIFLAPDGELRHWRGARDEREWPVRLARGGVGRMPWERATSKDITFAKMMEVQRANPDRLLSVRAIEQGLIEMGLGKGAGISKTNVANALKANQAQWDALLSELGLPSRPVENP